MVRLGPTLGLQVVMDGPEVSVLELALVFIGGVALYLLMRFVRWAFPLVPMRRERRGMWTRIGPLAEVVVWLAYVISAIAWTLSSYPAIRLGALVVLGLVVIFGLWSVIRDYLAGVVLRTEGTLARGDVVRVGELEGTVTRFGARAVELDLPHGDRVVLPYRALGDSAVVRRGTQRTSIRHTFELVLPTGLPIDVARGRIRRAILLCHWVPPLHEPKIIVKNGSTLEVTLNALSELRIPDVEAIVRAVIVAE